MFVETRKYRYHRLCCSKYISNTTQPNELNEYFRYYLKEVLVRPYHME